MAIPNYQTFMLPLLRLTQDGKEHSVKEFLEPLAKEFQLNEEDLSVMNQSGQTTFYNRVAWAKTYLRQAGLLEPMKRGSFRITDRGQEILKKNFTSIDVKFLQQFKEFTEFRSRKTTEEHQDSVSTLGIANQQTPEETVEMAFRKFRQELEAELLQTLKACSPGLFEKIVVDVLVKMGYGGNRLDAGEAIGKSGDGGIDGIIKEDRLGLDTIYIQAKKWEGSVGRPDVQKFAGALQGMRAKKGVLITTSSFTREAHDYVAHLENKIVLIDGQRLADLMIDFNVGISPLERYETKKIDMDYFEE
jgi:restriction system protein